MGYNDERSEEQKLEDQKSLRAHYGWLYVLHELAQSPILQLTGDKCITDLNTIFAFDYLSMISEITLEKNERIRQQQQLRS
jgi:hypothetical protein